MSSSCRHPDFEKIHSAFLSHYSKDPKLGESRYEDWVKFSGLDQFQSYYLQGAARANKSKENFEWANFLLQFVKEDKDAFYYKVEALFPVESMNKDSPPFTRDEVLQAARSLTGKPSDLNHDHKKMLDGVTVEAAQFEDDCVECLVRVPKTSQLVGMIERKEIVNVSIEGEWSHGVPGHGLVLTGLGWLTKDTMLPGIPLTRIMPVERIAESFLAKKVFKESVKQESDVYCVFCKNPADYFVSICKSCCDKLVPNTPPSSEAKYSSKQGVEILEEKQIDEIAQKIAAKIGEKSPEIEKFRNDLSEAKTKLLEAEEKTKVAEGRSKLAESASIEATGKLAAANKAIEAFKKAVPGVELMATIPKLVAVTEVLADLEKLRFLPVVENTSTFSKIQGGKVKNIIKKYEGKLEEISP